MELFWGIHFEEIALLLRQAGLAIVGAAGLWGLVLSTRDTRTDKAKTWIIDDWISIRLLYLVAGGTALATAAYWILASILTVSAHEGISIQPSVPEIITTFPLMSVLFGVLIGLTLFIFILRAYNEELFSYAITPFYATVFLLGFVMTSLSGWRGTLDAEQIFYFIHGFHSVFTLGSVIVLDYLFILSSRSEVLKQHVYSLFPTISKVIWVGLSLDFVSVFLITGYFVPTEKFLFVQTVIAILIINGTLLSGPIARKMSEAIRAGIRTLEHKWRIAGNIAGAISVTSWITITALDFFESLTLSYLHLALLYIGAIVLAVCAHALFERYEKRRLGPLV